MGKMRAEEAEVIVDDKIISGTDVHAIIEPVWDAVDVNSDDGEYESAVRQFTNGQRLVLALQAYRGDMVDGGHQMFLSNASRTLLEDVVAALVAFDLMDLESILVAAVERTGGPSRSRKDRADLLENVDFDDLDERFFQVDSDDFVDCRVLEFVRSNRQEFYFNGKVFRGIDSI